MTESTKESMDFVGYRPSKRNDRKRAALWRMFDTQRATQRHLGALRDATRQTLNLDNKPLGA